MKTPNWILTLLAPLLVCLAWSCAPTPTANQELTPAGVWDLRGLDDAGTEFLATLVLSMDTSGSVSGYVDWIGASGSTGREHLSGEFDYATRNLGFAGTRVEHRDRIVQCTYNATLSASGAQLDDGTWTHNNEPVIPGTWVATRVRP